VIVNQDRGRRRPRQFRHIICSQRGGSHLQRRLDGIDASRIVALCDSGTEASNPVRTSWAIKMPTHPQTQSCRHCYKSFGTNQSKPQSETPPAGCVACVKPVDFLRGVAICIRHDTKGCVVTQCGYNQRRRALHLSRSLRVDVALQRYGRVAERRDRIGNTIPRCISSMCLSPHRRLSCRGYGVGDLLQSLRAASTTHAHTPERIVLMTLPVETRDPGRGTRFSVTVGHDDCRATQQ
jgi:hypothetical protein